MLMNSTHFVQDQLLAMPLGLLGNFANVQLQKHDMWKSRLKSVSSSA